MKLIKTILLLTIFSFTFLASCQMAPTTCNVKVIYNDDFVNDASFTIPYGSKLEIDGEKINYYDFETRKVVSFTTEDGEEFDFETKVTKSITLYAKWEQLQYTYTFYDAQGNVIKQVTAPYGTEIEYPEAPTKEGEGYIYTFRSWTRNDVTLTKDLDFRPIFDSEKLSVTIIIKNIDGSVIKTYQATYGEVLDKPSEPEIEKEAGYIYMLTGWRNEMTNEMFDFDTKVVEDVTLVPVFDKGKTIDVALDTCKVSILGDSISTFYTPTSEMSSIYHGDNQFYYPRYSATVTSVNLTWWYKTIKALNLTLGINCSLSGSAAYGSSSTAGMSASRLKLLNGKGAPNIVFVYLGTNDNVNGHTTEQIKSAYKQICDYITENCIERREEGFVIPKIYLFTNGYTAYQGYSYTENDRLSFNEMIKDLANEYENVRVFDLAKYVTTENYSACLGDNLHYNDYGHDIIATNLIKQLKSDYNVEENGDNGTNANNVAYVEQKKKEQEDI